MLKLKKGEHEDHMLLKEGRKKAKGSKPRSWEVTSLRSLLPLGTGKASYSKAVSYFRMMLGSLLNKQSLNTSLFKGK